ncbi:MAG: hypothetical protein H6566_01180 [Lewinellaceae bacterium]|nr:hypothetical protein [Lewinellaceae bacterium]
MNVGKELADVKLSSIIREMGLGISQAQFELDKSSMRVAQMMSGTPIKDKDGTVLEEGVLVQFGDKKYSMLELGFTPTFYQFVDTILEVKMSISMTLSESDSKMNVDVQGKASLNRAPWDLGASMSASTVSASFASKYQYSAEGSSLIRTKLVPVPPPAILEERLRKIMDENPIPDDKRKVT